jgi:nucleoside phosphorylase
MIFEKDASVEMHSVNTDSLGRNVIDDRPSCDVCIICPTTKDVNVLIDDVASHWHLTFKRMYSHHNNIEYYRTSMHNFKGENLIIHVSWQSEYGPLTASSHLDLVIKEFRPRFVAMMGVCAGDRKKVKLGDLAVASSTFSYDDQFIKNLDNLQKYQFALDFSYLNPKIKIFVNDFGEWRESIEKVKKVHPIYQARKENTRGIMDTILFKSHNISSNEYDLHISSYKRSIRKLRVKFGYCYRKYRLFLCKFRMGTFNFEEASSDLYIAPMALVNRVRRDNPFDNIQKLVNEAITLDMEAGAFYRTAESFPGTYALVVKGICDYADDDKDDAYYRYASSLSAMYIVHFISKYITSDMMAESQK